MTAQKIALITGAARGIGYACAEVLQEEGARVIVADVNAEGAKLAAGKFGNGAIGLGCDIGKPEQIESMFDRIESEAGPVSILVNAAGISIPASFLETTLEQFQSVLNVNLVGAFLCTQRAAKAMIASKIEGSIVNITSINAQVAIPTIVAYSASKGGMMQMMKTAALALAPYNIRVNAVGPGSIDTTMLSAVNKDEQAMRTLLSRTPLKRIGTPREVANAVAFLASDKASYITGETIYIDGGRLALNYTV